MPGRRTSTLADSKSPHPTRIQGTLSAQLSADGTLTVGPEDAGDYEVDLNLGHSLFVQSVRLRTRNQGTLFHLSENTTPKLDVEVSGDSGQVNATIVPDSSLPLPSRLRARLAVNRYFRNTTWSFFLTRFFLCMRTRVRWQKLSMANATQIPLA